MKPFTLKSTLFFILFFAELPFFTVIRAQQLIFPVRLNASSHESSPSFRKEALEVSNDLLSFTNHSESKPDTVPLPKSVMFQSLIIPGWGQVTNKQGWKIPIIYGALAGVAYYVYWLDGRYDQFRAAYYNSFADTNPKYADQKFGPTPSRLIGVNRDQLKYYRNYYRNERDFMLIIFGLTYGLNAIDAYIFAHLRDYDVSDNLSLSISPRLEPHQAGMSLLIKF